MATVSLSGNAYEIYGTEAALKIYFAAGLNAAAVAYAAASSTDHKKAMVTAARMFNRTGWVGEMTDPTTPQALAWPRTGVSDAEGNAISSSVIPTEIEEGSYELAGALLVSANTIEASDTSGSNVRRALTTKIVGPIETTAETEYFKPTDLTSGRYPLPVHELVSFALSGANLTFAVVNGACDDSAFDDDYSVVFQ